MVLQFNKVRCKKNYYYYYYFRCSDGIDRHRQEWYLSDCYLNVCNYYNNVFLLFFPSLQHHVASQAVSVALDFNNN